MSKYLSKNETRDDLMVTMGTRAGYMECAGEILLPEGVNGEFAFSKFVAEKVDYYIDEEIDESFDLYIEEELIRKYGI